MAGEYDINLSNGSVLATLYPLEVSGPDNRSTPRQIQNVKPSFEITFLASAVGSPPQDVITIDGIWDNYFPNGLVFEITGSTSNDGTYTVVETTTTTGPDKTHIEITNGALSSVSPVDGEVLINAFVLNSDVTSRFVSGLTFEVQEAFAGSPSNNGTYSVASLGSYLAGTKTVIPVIEPIPTDGLPYGEIEYTNPDSRSSLKLPGKGTLNYGEMLIENLVRITENFAADVEPENNTDLGINPAAEPLVGQWWYKTLSGDEGFRYWSGTEWISSLDINDGSLVFKDVEDGNTDIYLTGSESSLPAPWPGGSPVGSPNINEPGFVIWKENYPTDGEPVFRVLAAGTEELLRIEYDSAGTAGYIRTINNLEVQGTDESTFAGDVSSDSQFLGSSSTFAAPSFAFRDATGSGLFSSGSTTMGLSVGGVESMELRLGDIRPKHQILNIDGTEPLPALSFVDDPDTGIYRPSTNQIAFVTSGTTRMSMGTTFVQTTIPILSLDGTFVDPSYSFTNDNSTGMFLSSAGVLAFAASSTSILRLDTSKVRSFVPFWGELGTAADPTFSFAGNPDTGMFRESGGTIGFSSGGTLALTISLVDGVESATKILIPNGSSIEPSLTFASDSNTGIYRTGTDAIGFATGGILRLEVSNSAIESTATFVVPDGNATSPSYRFASDTNSGFYLSAGNTIGITTNGTNRVDIGTSAITSNLLFYNANGAAGFPSYTFASDPDTGMYRSGANQLGFATASTNRLNIESDGTLNVSGTTNYETLVTDDDDIPNKKYVDDTISGTSIEELNNVSYVGSPSPNDGDILVYNQSAGEWQPASLASIGDLYDEFIASSSQTVFNTTNVTTITKTSNRAFLRVFVNGVLQREGEVVVGSPAGSPSGSPATSSTGDFVVTGSNEITFNSPVPSSAWVAVYGV